MIKTKTYTIEIILPEGSDEWWEELNGLMAKDARQMMKEEIASCLQSRGFFDAKVKVTKIEVNKA